MGIGIDFCTTNSVLAHATPSGVRVEQFPTGEGTNFRSVIFFPEEFPPDPKNVEVGPLALESYQ